MTAVLWTVGVVVALNAGFNDSRRERHSAMAIGLKAAARGDE